MMLTVQCYIYIILHSVSDDVDMLIIVVEQICGGSLGELEWEREGRRGEWLGVE